jgi:DNA-binding transcriptional regulator YiaG
MMKDKYDSTEYRELAEKASPTHVEIARYFGVSVRTVYRWYYGQTKVPVSVLKALKLLLKEQQ